MQVLKIKDWFKNKVQQFVILSYFYTRIDEVCRIKDNKKFCWWDELHFSEINRHGKNYNFIVYIHAFNADLIKADLCFKTYTENIKDPYIFFNKEFEINKIDKLAYKQIFYDTLEEYDNELKKPIGQ